MYNPTNPAKDVYRTADAILRMFNPNKGTKPVKKSTGLLAKSGTIRSMATPNKETPLDVSLQYAQIFREKREKLNNESGTQ